VGLRANSAHAEEKEIEKDGLRARVREESFPNFHFFSILFSKTNLKSKLNQIQIEFRIYFSTQIKMENFSRLSKIKFITF